VSANYYTKENLQTVGQSAVNYGNVTNKPTNLDEDKSDDVTLSGDQTISGNKTFVGRTTVPTPVNASDATTKAYVDALKQQVKDLENIIYTQLPLPTNGLVAYYPFNGNANDESGNGNNGSIIDATLANDRIGRLNSAYSFNGTSSKITVNFSTPLNTRNYSGLTISAWCKLNDLIANPYNILTIMDNSFKGFILTYDSNISYRRFYAAKLTKPIYTLDSTVTNVWYNLTLTYDNTTNVSRFYLNNVLQGEITNDTLKPSLINLYIGYHNSDSWGFGWYMNGLIDDIRIYNRVLTETEIMQLYHEEAYTLPEMVTDIDGNSYSTVKIGDQQWMTENLKTTKFNDGSDIPLVTDGTTWINLTTPAYCWYNNDANTYKDAYGGLYNLYTVMTGKLCPVGWHVPSNDEWAILATFLGGNAVAGGKLKETGTTHWFSPNVGATNEAGFNALPTGYRADYNGGFFANVHDGDKNHSDIWSSTLFDPGDAYFRNLFNNSAELSVRTDGRWRLGLNVRCLKN